VLESLGAGGFGRAFKVERDEQPGYPYMLKVALRPSSPHAPEEENVHERLAREVAIHMAYETGVKVRSVDHWPTPEGYLYFVTDYVEGETFHEWCWRTQPSAARLMDVFSQVVRQVGALHQRGVCHRDLKSDNILIRKGDETPHLLDYGAARLPGMATLTVGVPPTSPHLVPPECLEFLKEETWRQGARYDPGVPGDLYALGLLLYEALTDSYAFDPQLPYNALAVVIMAKPPVAPHLLNPKVPRTLSDIAMRLLEKRPEARYPSAEALLQALWEAAKERKQPEWQVPLALPPPAEQPAPAKTRSPSEVAVPTAPEAPAPTDAQKGPEVAGEETTPPVAPVAARARSSRGRWLPWGLCGLLVLFLALWVGLSTLASTPEKGSPSVPTAPVPHAPEAPRSSLARLLVTALCAVTGMGCPAAQVRPEPAKCPEEAREAMSRILKMNPAKGFIAVVDINQPGDQTQLGTYRDGPLVSRIVGYQLGDPALPDGTLLYGQLWTGIVDESGTPSVMARYFKAKLPDGRTYPVCLIFHNRDGLVSMRPGSKKGAAVLERELPLMAVERWP
jgi:serine/threonine-protein kinase